MKNGFWVCDAQENVFKEVKGHQIILPDYPELDLFVSWGLDIKALRTITEGRSGTKVAEEMSVSKAVHRAKAILDRWDKETIQERIQQRVERYGLSPRYKEEEENGI